MTLDEMIDRIEFSVTHRQLRVAEAMTTEFLNECSASPLKESGYAVLSVVVSYFEMFAQFLNGEESDGRSKKFFSQGYRAVYPDTGLADADIERVYKAIRCGMYHVGMPKLGTHLSRYFPVGFALAGMDIHINPGRVVVEIGQHFAAYIAELRDPANTVERSNFEKLCLQIGVNRTIPDSVPTGSSTTSRASTTPAPWHPGDGKQH